jgi:site-specific recombinase XerD
MVLGFWITQEKNAGRRADGGKRVFVPYTSELRTALAPLDRTTETVLVNKYRQPYAKSGMGKALQEWRWQAGLSKTGFSVHGLRANYITTGSEAGGTTREGMAAAGHDNVKDHETYTKSIESAQLSIRLGRKIDTMLAARGNRGQLLN